MSGVTLPPVHLNGNELIARVGAGPAQLLAPPGKIHHNSEETPDWFDSTAAGVEASPPFVKGGAATGVSSSGE